MFRDSLPLQPIARSVVLAQSTLLASLLLIAPAAHAQTTFDIPTANPGAPIKNKPFVADKLSHTRRSLADGTITTQDAQIWEARDSSGRVLVELKTTLPPTASRHSSIEFTLDSLLDPNTQTLLTWNSLGKSAILRSIPSPQMRALATAAAAGKAPPPPANSTTELLGHRLLHRLMTTGRRTQQTIAAGTLGNAIATESEHEWWTDDDLHLVVSDTSRSPQRGEQTIELQDLKLIEPDPARFRLPDGYTIRRIGPPIPGTASAALGTSLGTSPGTSPAASSSGPLDLAHAPALSHDDAMLKLKSDDRDQQIAAAAALVNEAQTSNSLRLKDEIAYQLARANVALSEARQLAEIAVQGAEITTSADHAGSVNRDDFSREATLGRYWHTLGYIYARGGETGLAKQYLESAWELDPHAYYGNHLGKLLEDTGHPAAALAIYRETLTGPGSANEKDQIRNKMQTLSAAVEAPPAAAPLLAGIAAPADGTALFDLLYTAGAGAPRVLFVSGVDALKPLAADIARSSPQTFALPDEGPEVIVRRVELTCHTASQPTPQPTPQPACQLRPLSALQAEDTFPH